MEQKPQSQKHRQNEKAEDYDQMKEQDKTPEKQLEWSEDRQLYRKRIQNNDSEDDPGHQKKNVGKDQEDARNV